MNINNISREAIQKELHRWFGPSPMSSPLQQRISNRGIMEWSHRTRMVGVIDDFTTQVIEKVRQRSHAGELAHHQRQIKIEIDGVLVYMSRPMTPKAIIALNPKVLWQWPKQLCNN